MKISQSDVGFHDSSINEIIQVHRSIRLLLEGASMGESTYWMTATISNIDRITRDGAPIADLRLEAEYGHILDLERCNDVIKLVVIWRRYSPSSEDLHSYEISRKDIKLELVLGAQIEGPD